MRSKDNFINRFYEPLDVSQRLVCLTDGSPATQVYNTDTGEYEPNREITPTVIYPDITAWASDNSWANKQCNSILDEMVWKVNGVDITTIASWKGKYEILQDGSMRGALKVMRNLTREEKSSLTFSAIIPDYRLQTRLKVNTEELVLSTYNKTEDTYGLSFGNADKILYNPFLDKLALYDYKVAHGLITFSNEDRQACYDGNQYERSVPLHVYKGVKEINTGYTVKVLKIVNANTLVDVSNGYSEVAKVTTSEVVFDLRAIDSGDYAIRIVVGKNVVAQRQISFGRTYQDYEAEVLNLTAIYNDDKQKKHKALITIDKNVVECPESILEIKWFTQAIDVSNNATTEKYWNVGETVVYDIEKTGVGKTISDGIHVLYDASFKGALQDAADKDGNVYTDADGNTYMFN
nr:MAG TPA: hypothetical protein [Bacteriophage sp.]